MTTRSAAIRAGLCSVTFRELGVGDVIAHAGQAGLDAIEWGTDVHVPLDDLDGASRTGELTRDAGLAVASLGSYFRCTPSEDIDGLLAAASAIGATRVRVWAGRAGSASVTSAERAETTAILRESALRAEDYGVELAVEFHGGTLTDTGDSARRLLEEVASDNVSSYWQPSKGLSDDAAVAELEAVAPWVSAVHVFSWWPDSERLPLDGRSDLWRRVLPFLQTLPRVTDALLEFVPDDDPALLPSEARTLRHWLA
ncbi:MAG: TIM barrel protein [Microbacterium sp.]